MLGWLYENTAFVSMLMSIATALIWLVYLQLLLTGRNRERKSLISINRGSGKNLEASLVLCNLGYETVYVTDVIAEIDIDGQVFAANVTECEGTSDDTVFSPLSGTLQGPLGNGGIRGLGTIQGILERIKEQNDYGSFENLKGISIIALAGREKSIGVRRHYRLIHSEGKVYLDADMMKTNKISARKARRYRESWGYDVPKGYDGQAGHYHATAA